MTEQNPLTRIILRKFLCIIQRSSINISKYQADIGAIGQTAAADALQRSLREPTGRVAEQQDRRLIRRGFGRDDCAVDRMQTIYQILNAGVRLRRRRVASFPVDRLKLFYFIQNFVRRLGARQQIWRAAH